MPVYLTLMIRVGCDSLIRPSNTIVNKNGLNGDLLSAQHLWNILFSYKRCLNLPQVVHSKHFLNAIGA